MGQPQRGRGRKNVPGEKLTGNTKISEPRSHCSRSEHPLEEAMVTVRGQGVWCRVATEQQRGAMEAFFLWCVQGNTVFWKETLLP